MRPSSRQIRAMPQLISPVEIRQEHEEVKKEPGQKRIPSHILDLRFIPKKTATMVWSGKFRQQLHHSMTARLTSQKKAKLYTGTRDISVLNLWGSMQPWNGVYGITLLVSGINSETNGSQENDLLVKDPTPLSRLFSNRLILWSRLLHECMLKWSLQQWVSISALSVPSNTGGLSSGCYLIWKKRENFRGNIPDFS